MVRARVCSACRACARFPDNGIIELTHTKSVFLHDIAPRAWKAVTQLVGGDDRIAVQEVRDDFNLNTQTVPEQEWLPPIARRPAGTSMATTSSVSSTVPSRGCLCLILWSDVAAKEGGTFLACDSIGKVARLLLDSSHGLDPRPFSMVFKECDRFRRGDRRRRRRGPVPSVHDSCAISPKARNHVRLLTNPVISLLEPMQFNRPNAADFSPVELGILRGLGVERLDYRHDRRRERFEPWRRSREIDEVRN